MNILLLLQTFASTIALIVIALAASLAPRRYAVASSMAGLAILALGLAGWWEIRGTERPVAAISLDSDLAPSLYSRP